MSSSLHGRLLLQYLNGMKEKTIRSFCFWGFNGDFVSFSTIIASYKYGKFKSSIPIIQSQNLPFDITNPPCTDDAKKIFQLFCKLYVQSNEWFDSWIVVHRCCCGWPFGCRLIDICLLNFGIYSDKKKTYQLMPYLMALYFLISICVASPFSWKRTKEKTKNRKMVTERERLGN